MWRFATCQTEKCGEMSDIGDRLKEERIRLGLTQADLGVRCGVSRDAQTSYESGRRDMGTGYLAAIAEVGADVSYILTGVRSAKRGSVASEDSLGEFPEIDAEYVLRVLHALELYIKKERLSVDPEKKALLVRLMCRVLAKQSRAEGAIKSASAAMKIDPQDLAPYLDAMLLAK
ncbi:MAG: helix-turn-helix transcriptional regulator [Magnetococcales bacterium]|nr:helix-turn-helix transcriptional regulator [Magnetococcales bacterium]